MKHSIEPPPIFPILLSIQIDDLDEALRLWHQLNAADNTLEDTAKSASLRLPENGSGDNFQLWNTLDNILKNLPEAFKKK